MKINQPLPRSREPYRFMKAEGIGNFIQEAKEEGIELNSLMILVHGRVLFETWYAPYAPELPHAMHSFTKGLTSAAVGFLVEEGRLSLADSVISFFPERCPDEISENLRKMTVWHLLTMTCGHETEPARTGVEDYIRNFLNWPVPYEPGTHFYYNSMGTYMLTAILKKLTGQNLVSYLWPRLLEPLGIYDVCCDQCPMGVENGGGGAYLRTEDMAKIAQLYLQNGLWNGTRLMDPEWIKQSVSVQFSGSYDHMFPEKEDWKHGYGFFFWQCRVPGVYRFDGSFGQFGIVIPQYDAVIVTTASDPMPERILELCWKHLLPALSKEDRQENWKELVKNTSDLNMKWYNEDGMVRNRKAPSDEAVFRMIFDFPDNRDSMIPRWRRSQKPKPPYVKSAAEGIRWCSLSSEEGTVWLRYEEDGIHNRIPLGTPEHPGRGLLKSSFSDFPAAAVGRWTAKDVFEVQIRLITTAHRGIYRFEFVRGEDGAVDHVILTLSETPYDERLKTPESRTYHLTVHEK